MYQSISGSFPSDVVIYTTPRVLQSHMELDFIFREIFLGCLYTIDIHEAISARCIVYMEHDLDVNIAKYIIENGKNLVIYHLGDERGDKTTDAYQFAQAILRNYFHKHIFEREDYRSKTFWMPNGYRNGIGRGPNNTVKPATKRKRLARFIGWLDNSESINGERKSFKHVAGNIPAHLDCVPMPGFGGNFSPHLYSTLMEESVFAPCPAGNAKETIRLFDVLETGCIPITLRHEFLQDTRMLAPCPYVFIKTWEQLQEVIIQQSLPDSKSHYEANQTKVVNHWRMIKANASNIAKRCVLL